MDPATISAILLVLGVVFLVLEVKIPGFFIAIPGTVLLLMGTMGLMLPGLLLSAASPLIALAGAIAASVISIRFYKRLGLPSPPMASHLEGLIGETGIVVREIGGDALRGRVRVGGQLWSSTAVEPLPVGTRVLVFGTEGGLLLVGPPPEGLGPDPRHRLGAGGEPPSDPMS